MMLEERLQAEFDDFCRRSGVSERERREVRLWLWGLLASELLERIEKKRAGVKGKR